MSKQVVVRMTEFGAKVLINPSALMPGDLLNPDRSMISGLPPHMWDIENGKIVPASDGKVAQREAALSARPLVSKIDSAVSAMTTAIVPAQARTKRAGEVLIQIITSGLVSAAVSYLMRS